MMNMMMDQQNKHKIFKVIGMIIVLILVVKIIDSDRHDANAQKDTIVVNGKGELYVKPDIATISFAVLSENLDVSKASDAVNTKIAKIVETLKADGVAEDDIKTTDYSLYPRYNYLNQTYPYNGKQVLAGYDVTQNIEVKIRDLSKTGTIVTDLSVSGVTNLSGLNFTNDKYDDLVRQARDAAIADARSQAKLLAKSLGVRLVKIVAYSEGTNYPIPFMKASSADYGVGGSVEATVPTGVNKITSNVSITYEIR